MTVRILILCLTCLGTVASARAEPAPDEPISRVPQQPLWEAGLFGLGISQPAYPGADEHVNRLLGLPYVIYRGTYLRAERGGVNLRALQSPRSELDVGFAASLGSHAADIAARRGMADLGTMIEVGPRLSVKLDDAGNTRLRFALREVIDVSHGFATRGIAFEPQWETGRRLPGGWFVSTQLGALFGDSQLGDTYYGVTSAEATASRASYSAKGGLIALRAGLLAAHMLTSDVRLFCILRVESTAAAANRDSPLLRRNAGWGAGVGLSWALARSSRYAVD